MATTTTIRRIPIVYALLAFLLLRFSSSTDTPPEQSPSPSPQQSNSPLLSSPPLLPPPSLSPETGSPSPTTLASPPAPPLSDLTVPVPAPAENVPDPDPSVASDINVKAGSGSGDDGEEESEGMSGGKKAGIAAAVIGAACLVGLGGLVYKKRQDNIRRSAYGYAARRELL